MFLRKKISVTKNFHPHPHASAQPSEHSPQSWCNNKYSQQLLCEIWTTTTNTSNKYTMSAISLYTSSSLSINNQLECSTTIYNHCICITTAQQHAQAGTLVTCIYMYATLWDIIVYYGPEGRPYSNQRVCPSVRPFVRPSVRPSIRHRLFLLTGSSLCSLLLRNYLTDFSNVDTNELREQCRCATCTSF